MSPANFALGRRRQGRGLPKYYTIKAVAEAVDVSPRTIRRWIANADLIVHRVNGVVRVSEDDLGAFLALHRDG
jgi:excisionase family DNA binding protein